MFGFLLLVARLGLLHHKMHRQWQVWEVWRLQPARCGAKVMAKPFLVLRLILSSALSQPYVYYICTTILLASILGRPSQHKKHN
jgi:hypothetical protein